MSSSRSLRAIARARPAVEHGEDEIDLAQVAEQLRAGPRDVHDAHRGGRDLLRADRLGELTQPVVGDGGHADVVPARRLRAVSARKSDVLPAFGSPTIPTWSAT